MTVNQKISVSIVIALAGVLIYLLSPILTPFIIAGFLAYLGDPLVNRLTHYRIPRTAAASIVFMLIAILILSFILMLIPVLQRQFAMLITKFPAFLAWSQQTAIPWLNQHLGTEETFDIEAIKTTLSTHWQQAGNVAAIILKTVSRSGHTLIIWAINLILIPIVTFYLLRDWDRVIKESRVLIPRNLEPTIMQLSRECNEVLGAFFRGQLIVMLALGLVYAAGLWLAGIEAALLVGVVAGLFSIVPYLGFIVGILIASIAALVQYQDVTHLLYVLAIFAIGHIIEGMILTPWLVGDRIGLHPVAVIFAILAGGQLFGFIGVLLALPVAAVIMVLLRYFKQRYIQSRLYTYYT